MHLLSHNIEKLEEINELTSALSSELYKKKFKYLSEATIGQHVRHILEFYIEFENGLTSKFINYDKRKRNLNLETNLSYCAKEIARIIEFINTINKDEACAVAVNYSDASEDILLKSSIYRELAFLVEHTVHHMAIFKPALIIENLSISDTFGLAASTKKHRNTCAQ